jgi:hypothetical protein
MMGNAIRHFSVASKSGGEIGRGVGGAEDEALGIGALAGAGPTENKRHRRQCRRAI